MTEVLDRLQDLAIRYRAKIWLEDELIAAIDRDTVAAKRALYDPQVQKELFLRDVALWRGADKKFRLIDQQPPDSVAQARAFVTTRTDGPVCVFCRLADQQVEFITIGHSHVHPRCRRAWFRWTRTALRDDQPIGPHWSEVLRIDRRVASSKEINAAYKRLAQHAHPDKGGSAELMTQLNKAREEALASPQAAT